MTASIPIDIAVGIPPLETAAGDYATSIIEDLDLPARASVRTAALAGVGQGVPVTIEGATMVDATGGDPAERVAFAIYRNRRALATTSLAVAYAAALWPGARLCSYTTEKLRELMAACIERNIRLRRLREVLRTREPADLWDTWELLCRAHTAETVAVRIEFAPVSWAYALFNDDPGGAWEAVQCRLFDTTGLLCPRLQAVTQGELSRRDWRLCINDVALPIRRRRSDDREAALSTIVADLAGSAEALLTRDEVSRRMNLIEKTFPVLVSEAVRRVGLNRIVTILGILVRNGTPLDNLERILDELTCTLVPYELEDAALQIVESPMDLTWRRKRGEGERAPTAEEYAGALEARLRIPG